MVGSAKSAVVTLLTFSALAASAALPPYASGQVLPRSRRGSAAITQEENKEHVSVNFKSTCNACYEGVDSDVIFYLDILSTNSVCGESNIRLNGQYLDLQWDGVSAVGEGNITAELANGLGLREFLLHWHSLCISSPKGSIEEYAAQILTVTFAPTFQPAPEETSGFAVSFNSVGQPKLFRLVNSPVEISADDDLSGEWLVPVDSTNPHLQQQLSQEPIDLETELKQLEWLKEQAARLDAMIREKDREIRLQLLSDCTFMSSQLKQCKDLKCFIGTSFQIVPDLFRLLKYKFGPLPSSLSGSPCYPSSEGTPQRNTSSDVYFPRLNATAAWTTEVFNTSSIEPPPDVPGIPAPSSDNEPGARVRHVIHHTAVVLLTLAIAVLLLKYCSNTVAWKRKRADFAARREERRRGYAYRRAALRYRLQVWWESFFGPQRGSEGDRSSQHSRVRGDARRTVDFGDDDDDTSDDGGATNFGAEILSLRRVLEYVGELVRYNEPEDAYHYRRRDQELEGLYTHRAGTPAPSSTAPLTTIGSPRTSSVLSYETDTLDTVDSLEIETTTAISG
ncbi:hypothetical protein VTO42DRAFT_8011 [Malbranchea cinnamomea]